MKKTFWSLGLALAALVALVAPGAAPAEEPACDAPAVQVAVPAAEAAPIDLSAALAVPDAMPVVSSLEPEITLEPGRMACVPAECSTKYDCPSGQRCVAKCCTG